MIFEGRTPVNPEVKQLHEHFGRPEKGQTFSHDEIGKIIGEKYPDNRYRTITNTWRKQVFKMYAVIIDAIPGKGFKALDDSEGLQYSDRKFVESGRKLKRAAQSAISIDESNLSDDQRSVLHHRIATHAKLQQAYAAEARRKLTD
jgi:hypothetical protein